MTPRDLILLILRDVGVVGVGRSALSEDVNETFKRLNMMLAQWNRQRLLIDHLIETTVVSTGAQNYTIGSGGNFAISGRVTKIQSAFRRQVSPPPPNQVDDPLEILQGREDYNRITMKQAPGTPSAVFLEVGNPLGKVYVWPVAPSGMWEIHLAIQASLAPFSSLDETITYPDEYLEAILYNGGLRMRAAYHVSDTPETTATVARLAATSLSTIKRANVEMPLLIPAVPRWSTVPYPGIIIRG